MNSEKLSRRSFDNNASPSPLNYDLKPFLNSESVSCLENKSDTIRINSRSTENFKHSTDNIQRISTENLLARCKSGSMDALEELLRRYRKYIFSTALKICKNYDMAEDIAAAASMRICIGIKSCKRSEALASWMSRVVRNVWLDKMRSIQRHPQISLTTLDTMLDCGVVRVQDICPDLTMQDRLEKEERNNLLYGAIGALPDRQERIINLYHFQDRTYEEIAVIMEMPVGTVKSRLNRARVALRSMLNDEASLLSV